jgi:hypothetical protein
MFREKTLFILGAGASYPYGYPLGKELINEIIKNIESDFILLPILKDIGNKYDWDENSGKEIQGKLEKGYEFIDFKSHLEVIDPDYFANNLQMQEVSFGYGTATVIPQDNNNRYTRVRLNQINEFYELKKVLADFDPVSIDSFLRDNPSYTEIGKIMIIYSLLKHEDKSKFSLKAQNEDNWYSYLINDIFSGCIKVEDLLANQLDIITFNYDMSLDYYLCSKVRQTELFQQDGIANTFVEQLKSERITHVYGQLYMDDVQTTYGSFSSQSHEPAFITQHKNTSRHNVNYPDMRRFVKALLSKDNIKLINPERNNQDKAIIKKIRQAKEIIIIGFGFDRDNLSILGFPIEKGRYVDFLDGKTIKYMDYKGRMNSLSDQFETIKKLSGNFMEAKNFTMTRSKAKRIVDAYQNDFKIYLYQ